jgi:hypothetical protein
MHQNLNVEINGHRINDVAEKIGSLFFGEEGRKIGKAIDSVTKGITIRIGTDEDTDPEA